ncbi:uncharacterized protein EDB93DRAFT_1103535 [Suillus bovinus]|uniref:uncharacterized protein n=1 Tax=Suillus bovinus TaxID=48563 RepID=UPI001B88485E|nr:uncharacterized protein EDB93DRAFT_1103535 [Suillus bovinus]KAG2150313.1 hypothetical protein EDB93DRAFT_1103535 [Suillus bovinus]
MASSVFSPMALALVLFLGQRMMEGAKSAGIERVGMGGEGVDINEDNLLFHGEVEGQAGDVMEELAGVEELAEVAEQAGVEQAEGMEQAEMFAAMQTAIALWDYAQEIVLDDMQYMQTHPHAPHPAHPPIQMSRCNKCLLGLMLEDRREAVTWLWQESNKMELLLGLEHI